MWLPLKKTGKREDGNVLSSQIRKSVYLRRGLRKLVLPPAVESDVAWEDDVGEFDDIIVVQCAYQEGTEV